MTDSEPERQVPPEGVWLCSPVAVEWHKDWDEFRSYINEYHEAMYQTFCQRTSTLVQKRNREIGGRANQAARGESSPTRGQHDADSDAGVNESECMIPAEFKKFWIKLVCTHGWNLKSRVKVIRKSFFDRSTGCKANIKAAVSWNDAESVNAFMINVTDVDVRHNHCVSKATYENHASNRRVKDPSVLAFMDELQTAGAKPKLMMQYLRKTTGKNATLRDVHNMVAKLREKRKSVLKQFCESSARALRVSR